MVMRFHNVMDGSLHESVPAVCVDHHDFGAILTFPHSGVFIPEELLSSLALEPGSPLLDQEWYLERIFPHVGMWLSSPINRYAVNLARARDDQGVALDMWKHPVFKHPLPLAVVERLSQTYYDPFHFCLEQAIVRMKQLHGYALVIDCHSMNSVGLPLFADAGALRAHFVVGDNDGRSCDGRIRDALVDALRANAQGWTVAINSPYKGGYITRTYGDPVNHVHVVQLEVQRALFMVESLSYDCPPADVLAFKEESARQVADALAVAFGAVVKSIRS